MDKRFTLHENSKSREEVAEAAFQAKKEEVQRTGADPFAVFTQKELMRILDEQDNFEGTHVDFDALQRHNQIVEAAHWLAENNSDIVKVEVLAAEKNKPHSSTCVEMKKLNWYRGEDPSHFATMFSLADHVCFTTQGKIIRVMFGVLNVWKK